MCRSLGPLVCELPTSLCSPIRVGLFERSNNDTAPASTCTTSRSKAWMTRSVAQKMVSHVEAELDTLRSTCRLLQSTTCTTCVAPLQRSEIQLGALLGEGGFSEVYQVTGFDFDEHDEEEPQRSARQQLAASSDQFVIKHLRKDLVTTKSTQKFHQAAADLVLEAQFLAHLDHPHIVQIRGWSRGGVSSFRDGSSAYFLVLDKLDETLSQRIRVWKEECHVTSRRPIHYATKLRYASEIAKALYYLHQHKIVYRDLKPDNIGIQNNSIQLFDLGLCRELPVSNDNSNQTFLMSLVGTRRYMAPEVALGKGYNLQVDVYSFAMVLYELFTHTKPFELYSRDMHQLLVCEEGQRPQLSSSGSSASSQVPAVLQILLKEAWATDPQQRPTSAILHLRLQAMLAAQAQTNKRRHLPKLLFGSLLRSRLLSRKSRSTCRH
jgi:serine/threonine protein kinase